MASKFNRNRAPGWASSDEEQPSDDGEYSSSDEESGSRNSFKRSRTNDRAPVSDSSVKMPNLNASSGGKPAAKKVNTVWSDVLVDQQLSGGMLSGVNVMSGDTFVPRGSETYDCTKSETNATGSTEDKDKHQPRKDEAMKKQEGDDDLFSAVDTKAPDWMETIASDKSKRGGSSGFGSGSRKRPWTRGGGGQRLSRKGGGPKDGNMEEGDNHGKSQNFAQGGGDRGGGRGDRGKWRGDRGRGRGHFRGDRSNSGPRRHLEKISFKREDSPKDIALEISKSLHEIKTELMIRAVENIGIEKAIQLYGRTVDVENEGGIMTMDGRRRRTSGGVFLYLLREDPEISEAQKEAVFGTEKEEYRQHLLAKRRFQKPPNRDEPNKMDSTGDAKPLKDKKEVFLEEALKQPNPGSSGHGDVTTEDVQMDG